MVQTENGRTQKLIIQRDVTLVVQIGSSKPSLTNIAFVTLIFSVYQACTTSLDSHPYVDPYPKDQVRSNHCAVTMTAAWHGGMPGDDDYVKSSSLQASISEAMDWWFQNDFVNPACLDSGGTSRCPCGTAGMWTTNWFSNVCYSQTELGYTSDFQRRSSSYQTSCPNPVYS